MLLPTQFVPQVYQEYLADPMMIPGISRANAIYYNDAWVNDDQMPAQFPGMSMNQYNKQLAQVSPSVEDIF